MPYLLLWMALCQALGILVADRLAGWLRTPPAEGTAGDILLFPHIAFPFLVTALLSNIILALFTHRDRLRAALACLLCFGLGAMSLGRHSLEAAWPYPEPVVECIVEGRVEAVRRGEGWSRFVLSEVGGVGGGVPPPRRIEVQLDWGRPGAGMPAPEKGERWRMRLRLRPVRSLSNPGGRSREAQLRRAGVGAIGRLSHSALALRIVEPEGLTLRIGRARSELARRLDALGPGAALLRALALGDRAGLSERDREAIAGLGLSHLLAVSGLHLGLVGLGVYTLAWFSLRRLTVFNARCDLRIWGAALGLGAAVVYAFLAGWGIPVRRALWVLCAFLLGAMSKCRASGLHSLALAAMLILALEPQALFEPGAQMSFAVSAALLLSAGRGEAVAGRWALRVFFTDLLRMSAVALAASAPIVARSFGALAPAGALWNLVAIPWTGFVLLPCALSVTAWVGLRAELQPWEASLLGRVAQVTGEGSLILIHALAPSFPRLAVNPSPAWPWLLAALGCTATGIGVGGTRAALTGATLCLGILALAPAASVPPAPPRVVFLDVGQGDATLVQGRDASLLVDGGSAFSGGGSMGAIAVLPALRALGVTGLDIVAISHGDLDHRGGIPDVLRGLPVGVLWLPFGSRDDPGFAAVVAIAEERGVAVRELGAGSDALRLGDLHVKPLWPDRELHGRSPNDRSLVLRVSLGEWSLLLPGDLEESGERALLARGGSLVAGWLKLGHHGSRSSSSTAFLKAVSPTDVVVSAPCDGRFGMPHDQVLARVREREARLWWTGRDGAVLVGEDGVRRWRGEGSGCGVWEDDAERGGSSD